MKGYKVFNEDWTCRKFKYEVGKTYELQGEVILCFNGFHFCKNLASCFNYYNFNPKNKVAEIEAIGQIVTDGNKSATNKIKIVREISWVEVLELSNLGLNNEGHNNVGDRNFGDYNSGHCNRGNQNSGNHNNGTGNSGDHNTGYRNTGSHNTGDNNTGNKNTGFFNTGNYNIGTQNTGSLNNGSNNTGNHNNGNYNSGDFNIGRYNTGNYNSGNFNTGDWNNGDHNTGCFNTKKQDFYMFNKKTNWTYSKWINSSAKKLLDKICLTEWIYYREMTYEEKKQNPNAERTGGCLREINMHKACNDWWKKLTDAEKYIITSLPNFDAKIFKQITGIDVNETNQCEGVM